MRFFDYIYIAIFVLLILTIIYSLIITSLNSQRIKKISRKVAVKKNIKFYIIWISLSVLNAFLNYENYRMALQKNDDTDVKLHLLAFFSWALCAICHIAIIFFDRYIYITPDGLFYKGMIKIQPKEKYRYRIDGDTLELYYKQNDNPERYGISGDREELAKILDENYVKYTEDLN